MTDNEVHSALVKWLAELTSATVIKAYQAREVPLPYVMVNLTTVREVRRHEQEIKYEGTTEVIAKPVIETEWMFSVNVYGPSPTDVLRPLRAAAVLAQVNEPLMPLLNVHEVSQIRHVPEYVNEKWEPRAQMDMFLRGLVKDGYEIDVIEQYSFDFV